MTMNASERNEADAYAGPGKSFPLYSSGAHLRAAWDLAGHAANPDAVRSKIRAFAKKHGLTKLLPTTAKAFDFDRDDHDYDDGDESTAAVINAVLAALKKRRGPNRDAEGETLAGTLLPGNTAPQSTGKPPKGGKQPPDVTQPEFMATKAASRVKELLSTAYSAAERADNGNLYDGGQREGVIKFAQEKGLAHHLPERAHGHMHACGMPHTHKGMADPQHVHTVKKATNVVAKYVTIEKAWAGDDGSCHIEGWVSTEDEDSEHDVVPPEAFAGALDGYAQRRMPLSSEHATKALPIGHGQHIALVRDGAIFKSAKHPTDTADFEHFPGSGTGVYGRFTITDPTHAAQVLKGNIGGFSFIGNLTEYEPLPGGGRKFVTLSPWLESTVAAYPINAKAVLLAAKAYEAQLAPQEEKPTVEDTLEALLAGALEAMQREEAATTPVAAITKAQLEQMFAGLGTKLEALVDAKVQKAAAESRVGVGRAASVTPADAGASEREADPANYIVRKATEAVEKGAELAREDKDLAWGIFHTVMTQGMTQGNE